MTVVVHSRWCILPVAPNNCGDPFPFLPQVGRRHFFCRLRCLREPKQVHAVSLDLSMIVSFGVRVEAGSRFIGDGRLSIRAACRGIFRAIHRHRNHRGRLACAFSLSLKIAFETVRDLEWNS